MSTQPSDQPDRAPKRPAVELTGELLIEVARAYFLEERSKSQIAEDLHLTRWQVARLVDESRRQGYVRIHVGDPEREDEDLAERVRSMFGIDHTTVVARSKVYDLAPSQDSVTRALAVHLAQVVRPGVRVGMTWSRVIEFLPRHLDRLAVCDVVQLAGALSYTGDRMGSVEVIRHVARVARGTAYPMYAPLFADDAMAAASFRRQPAIRECLDLVASLDLSVTSIGAWTSEGSALYPLFSTTEAEAIASSGGVGEISGRVFDAEGRPVAPELDERVVGITVDQLRAVPHKVVTSYGEHRAAATIAAIRGGFVDDLIIDEALATAMVTAGGRRG